MFTVCRVTDGKAMIIAGWKLSIIAVMAIVQYQAIAWAEQQPESAAESAAPADAPDDNAAGKQHEDAPKPTPDDPSEDATQEMSLLFMVRTNPDMRESTVRTNLQIVRPASGCKNEDMKIREVPQSTLEQIEAAVRLLDEQEPPEFGDEIKLRRIPSVRPIWQISVPVVGGEVLKEFRVTYRGRPEEVSYEPKPIDEAVDPGTVAVVSALQGRYEYRPDDAIDAPPVEYTAVLISPEKERRVKGDFLGGDRFFIISIGNFTGNQDKLFQALTDHSKERPLANPFTSISTQRRISLLFVDFESETGMTGERIEGVNLVVRVRSVEGRKGDDVARVWMLFPLTKEQCDEWCEELDALDNPIIDIPKLVRRNAVRSTEVPPLPLEEAKWFELLPSDEPGFGRGFERSIPLAQNPGDFDAVQNRSHRLLVWEFGSEKDGEGKVLQAFEVHGRFYARDEIERWSDMLNQSAGLESVDDPAAQQ